MTVDNGQTGTNCSTCPQAGQGPKGADDRQWREASRCYDRELDLLDSFPHQDAVRRANFAAW